MTLHSLSLPFDDNCGVNDVGINPSEINYNCTTIGLNQVTVFITDNSNNSNSCTAQLMVLDTTAPLISCNNATISLDQNGIAVIDTNGLINSVSDNCSFGFRLGK